MNQQEVREFIDSHKWTYAKTMPKHPHFYVVRNKCRGDDEFVGFVEHIRLYGYDKFFFKTLLRYLDFDGHTYWTMGYVVGATSIINRAVIEGNPVPNDIKNPFPFCAKPSDKVALKAGEK